MTGANPHLLRFLHTVHADDPARPQEACAGAHSDRHQVLLAHLCEVAGDASASTRQQLREAAAVEMQRVHALAETTALFADAGINCLILKGAALSYTVYPEPHLRPRNDDDLWVRESDFARACDVLEHAGYVAAVEVTAREITKQRHFRGWRGVVQHDVDLHWWPVNPSAFAALPSFETCWRSSVPLPAVGAHARAAGPVHAVLLACAHRVAHHTATEDAIWLCDLHFLVSRLQPDEWQRMGEAAHVARIAHVVGAELTRLRDVLSTPMPDDIVASLVAVAGEPSARHLRSLGPLGDLWLALRGQPDLSGRARLLRHHLLPPRRYMVERYGHGGAVLPLLYTYRAATGLTRWMAEYFARLTR